MQGIAAGEIVDRVGTAVGPENKGIVPFAAFQHIVTQAAVETVVPLAAVQFIIAAVAEQQIGAVHAV